MDSASAQVSAHIDLLKKLPLFAQISTRELEVLANHFLEVAYPANQLIVQENEAVDSVFIIITGNAEVSVFDKISKKPQKKVLAVLHPGEAIGLNDTGFFSTTGVRTATVTALTPVIVLRMALEDFQHFLQIYPDCIPAMKKSTDIMLRQQLIKKAEPFAQLDAELLQEVAEHIEEQEVTKDTIIFRQGDTAESCYLLCSGKVKVLFTKADGTEKVLAELGAGSLFGELALLTENKRNATIQAITPCKLLILKLPEFKKLVQQSADAFKAINALMLDRHRPLQSEGVTIHSRQDQQNVSVILKNATQGTYFKTSPEGLFVWELLDGQHTLHDIAVAFFYRFHKLAVNDIGSLVLSLMHSGFVKVPTLAPYIERPPLSIWTRALTSISNILEYQYSVKNVDAWVTNLYQQVGYLFFTRAAKILMMLLVIIGFCAFVGFLNQAGNILKVTPHAWLLLVLMGPANLISVPLHELAHALTTKAYGYQVSRFGVGWYWLGPIAFADTSDMWLSTRGPRIVVNLAGIYINFVIAGILSLLAWIIPDPTIAVFLWLVALAGYLMAFYNLNPLFELDGYYVLMDALDKPNLRADAIKWLLTDSKKTLCSLKLVRQYYAEIVYWMTSILFIVIAAIIAYVVQTFILYNMLPEKITNNVNVAYFRWSFVVLVVVLSILSVYQKVKQQSYLYK